MRRFRLKKNTEARGAGWLQRGAVYEGELVSTSPRLIRVFAPDTAERRPHVDLPYDWLIPVG